MISNTWGHECRVLKKIIIIIGFACSAINKIMFFRAAVESILIYEAKCWTLINDLERGLNETYTKMLRRVQNIS